jgi:hypothetical protein
MRKHAQLLVGLTFAFGIVWVPLTANAQQSGENASHRPAWKLFSDFTTL